MNISLVTIAFNDYGRFAGQFLAFVSAMNPKPDEVVVVLGQNHGADIPLMQAIYPGVKIVQYLKNPTFGKLRNIGISKTESEWTWFVSIDDKPMPDAITTFEAAIEREPADFICSEWYTIGLGQPLQIHKSPTPAMSAALLREGKKMGFIIAHSPFKRKLWEQKPYKNTDYPNYDFVGKCVQSGAVFTQADKPTTTYLRRPDSHARTTLLKTRSIARREKQNLHKVLLEHYCKEVV